MGKITSYAALTAPASADLLVIVDVDDLSMAPTGTDKSIAIGSAALLAVLLAAGGGTMGAGLAPKVAALTDAATILVNAALGNEMRVTLGGNRVMGAPSNPVDGQQIAFELVQDATGSRTVTWTGGAGGYSFGSGSAPNLSTAVHAVDLLAFRYSAAAGNGAGAWCYLGSLTGY